MRIGFDAKRAFSNTSGLGSYSRTLIRSLLTYFPSNDYVAFTPSVSPMMADTGKMKIVQPGSLPAKAFPSLWRSAWVTKDIEKENLSVFHGLSNELPRRLPASIGKMVTIHDLIFMRFPQWYPFLDRMIYEKKFRNACNDADTVVAVSEQTKKDIIHFFGTPENKITVAYQSCEDAFYPETDLHALSEFKWRKNLPDHFILYVGTVEKRKNLLAIVKAMTRVKDVSLVVVGKKKKYAERVYRFIQNNGLKARVLFPEKVSTAELALYYRSALGLVYPSYYEGFGIPVIEALWTGTPVIASERSSLPEAAGPSSLYFNPDDHEQLATNIQKLLDDHGLREKMIREGFEYVQRFHPKITSGDMMTLYSKFSN